MRVKRNYDDAAILTAWTPPEPAEETFMRSARRPHGLPSSARAHRSKRIAMRFRSASD
jgi:hypothetical protein